MKTLIKVTAKHIVDGVEENSIKCPIALAINESFMSIKWLVFKGCFVYRMMEGNIFSGQKYFQTPKSVKEFIKMVDTKKAVKPFQFYFDDELVSKKFIWE